MLSSSKGFGVVLFKKLFTRSVFTFLDDWGKSMKRCWVVLIPHASVWTHLPLHLCTSPHTFLFLWPQTHSMLLKMTAEPGQSTTALYSLQSNMRSARLCPSSRQTNWVQSSTFSPLLVFEKQRKKLPTAEGQRSLHNYRICCSVKAYYAMNGFNYYHW